MVEDIVGGWEVDASIFWRFIRGIFPQPLGEGSYGRRPPEEIQVSHDLHLPLSAGRGGAFSVKEGVT